MLYGLPDGEPTFSYDLDTAIKEGFLVNFHAFERTTKLLKTGLKYKDLSDAEKEEYEKVFGLYGFIPEEIDNKLFYSQIINKQTIDLVLDCVMNEGLRINSGEQLGKTIIFAVNHKHAEVIVKRFHELHPELGDNYCQLIDNTVKYADQIIEKFKVPEQEPVIAVSVDMLDTGIDVPEVLNLVFFKRVFSKIKFWQMLGRGTRTCLNLNVVSPRKDYFNGTSGDPAGSDEIENCTDKQGLPDLVILKENVGIERTGHLDRHSGELNDLITKVLIDDTMKNISFCPKIYTNTVNGAGFLQIFYDL